MVKKMVSVATATSTATAAAATAMTTMVAVATAKVAGTYNNHSMRQQKNGCRADSNGSCKAAIN